MALESIVGQDTTEIGVSSEKDSVHIPSLTLEPVHRVEKTGQRGDRRDLVSVGLDTDAAVEADRETVVDDLEAVGARGVVDSTDIHDLLELGVGVIAQELHDGQERVGCDVDSELILVNRELLNEFGED